MRNVRLLYPALTPVACVLLIIAMVMAGRRDMSVYAAMQEPEDPIYEDTVDSDTAVVTEILAEDTGESRGDSSRVRTMKQAFIMLQAPALMNITTLNRLDMLDYDEAGIKRGVLNAMEGLSYLDTLSTDYLRLRISNVSSYEMKFLKHGNDTILMALYTVGKTDMAPDTEICFYDMWLHPLQQKKFWSQPKVEDYLRLDGKPSDVRRNVVNAIEFPTFEFSIDPATNIVSGRLTVGKYMTDEDAALIKPYLIPEIAYLWNGKKFRKQKRR